MKILRQIAALLCVLVLAGSFSCNVYATQQAADIAQNGCFGLDATAPLLGNGQMVENVEGVVLYEIKTGTMMYTQNADVQLYPASLVKLMTALIAVQKGNMADIITVSEQALSTVPEEATDVGLQPNEVITLEELMYCMMVESANDAAAVIAEHICGNQNAFVAEMNRYAQELGCSGTNFTNPTGLHNDQQVTTARDMARILAVAMNDPLFYTFFTTSHYTVEATNKSEARALTTSNHMMHMDTYEIYYDARVTGGRTGVTTSGDCCLAVSAEENGMQLISIMLGAKSQYTEDGYTVKRIGGFDETKALLDQGLSGYKAVQLLYEGQAVMQAGVINGDADVVLGSRVSISSVLPQDTGLSDLSFQYTDLTGAITAPIHKGQHVTDLEIWCGNICVAQAELYSLNSVAERSEQPEEDNGVMQSGKWPLLLKIIVVILATLAGVVVFLRLVRRVHLLGIRSRSKNHRRNRRRSR